MGFQEERSAVSICNKALSRIHQQPLAGSLDDPANLNKQAGRECNLWYKTIVRQVLSEHHWGLATKRVPLVTKTNDRTLEWAVAYQPPSDMAFPVMIGPYSNTAGVSYYKGVEYLLGSLYGKPVFRYESGTIYAILEGATLDYVSFDITEADFNEAVESLVIMFLASELARSIAKDDKLGDNFYNQAINRQNHLIAQNFNMNKPRYGAAISDTEMARTGFDPTLDVYGLYR